MGDNSLSVRTFECDQGLFYFLYRKNGPALVLTEERFAVWSTETIDGFYALCTHLADGEMNVIFSEVEYGRFVMESARLIGGK